MVPPALAVFLMVTSALASTQVSWHQPWRYRAAFEKFMDEYVYMLSGFPARLFTISCSFIHPNETLKTIQDTGSAPSLADQCVGRVDLTNGDYFHSTAISGLQ